MGVDRSQVALYLPLTVHSFDGKLEGTKVLKIYFDEDDHETTFYW